MGITANTTNTLQPVNTSVSSNTAPNNAPASRGVIGHDPTNNLGYGLGKLLRGAFEQVSQAWQQWWTHEPSPEAKEPAGSIR